MICNKDPRCCDEIWLKLTESAIFLGLGLFKLYTGQFPDFFYCCIEEIHFLITNSPS